MVFNAGHLLINVDVSVRAVEILMASKSVFERRFECSRHFQRASHAGNEAPLAPKAE